MTGARVAIVFRGDRHAPPAPITDTRLGPVFDALLDVGLSPEVAVYDDHATGEIRAQLLDVGGALVWVDPVSDGGDRTKLDAILREVASAGVWVSAHPDTIVKMGTKEVLYRTRELAWGSETYFYNTVEEFNEQFPAALGTGGARVLKRCRGNGGIGVHKVELVSSPGADAIVRVQSARLRDEVTEELALDEFMQRCAPNFADSEGAGRLIDQRFQPRITEGIVRCYLVKGEVVGFARQYPHESSPGGDLSAPRAVFGLPSAKTMYGPRETTFRELRTLVESEWVPGLQTLVDVETSALPALWDADFLFGPRDGSGRDTYVLCEINVSSVLPFPPEAPPKLAQATLAAVVGARQ